MSAIRELADWMDTQQIFFKETQYKRPLEEYIYCGKWVSEMSEEEASNILQTRHTYGA